MNVHIPQAIVEYEPTVIWGLNRRQIMYAVIAVLGIAFFNLQFDFVPISLRLVISLLAGIATFAFMFLDLGRWVNSELAFHKAPKNAGFLDGKAREFMDIADIRDGIVRMKNGDIKTVMRVQPVNFAMLDETQQSAIFVAFKNFLDSLSGSSSADLVPIQILVKTNHLDLDSFFANTRAKVKETKSPALQRVVEHFERFFRNHIAQEKTIYRTFYVAVSLRRSLRR